MHGRNTRPHSQDGAIWPEFLNLVAGTPRNVPADAREHRIAYPASIATKPSVAALTPQGGGMDGYAASYSFSRLCFKANVIEPLAMTDSFRVVTKVGTFVLTKQEFYDEFPRVVASDSYRLKRIYHFPMPPARAMRFRVDTRRDY